MRNIDIILDLRLKELRNNIEKRRLELHMPEKLVYKKRDQDEVLDSDTG